MPWKIKISEFYHQALKLMFKNILENFTEVPQFLAINPLNAVLGEIEVKIKFICQTNSFFLSKAGH